MSALTGAGLHEGLDANRPLGRAWLASAIPAAVSALTRPDAEAPLMPRRALDSEGGAVRSGPVSVAAVVEAPKDSQT